MKQSIAIRCLIALAGISIGQIGLHAEEALTGAPPVIPHPVRDELNCQSCHGVLQKPGPSHLQRKNCRQCHVSLATTEQHQMLDVDWKEFEASWKAMSIPKPEPEVHIVDTYEGAPPAIPHSTEHAQNCSDCHASDLGRGLTSTHLDRQNCTQCHVSIAVMESRKFLKGDNNAFLADWVSPITSLKQGRRNPAKKPAMIPHGAIDMEDCLDCHSPDDTMGLGTTHPERNNCTQCHISSATDEDRKFLFHSLTELK
jgi:nitrate reductase cytochrome c-type subunit